MVADSKIGGGFNPWASTVVADARCFANWKASSTGNGKYLRIANAVIWVGLRRSVLSVCVLGSRWYIGDPNCIAKLQTSLEEHLCNSEEDMSEVLLDLYEQATDAERRALWGSVCNWCLSALIPVQFEMCWNCKQEMESDE